MAIGSCQVKPGTGFWGHISCFRNGGAQWGLGPVSLCKPVEWGANLTGARGARLNLTVSTPHYGLCHPGQVAPFL